LNETDATTGLAVRDAVGHPADAGYGMSEARFDPLPTGRVRYVLALDLVGPVRVPDGPRVAFVRLRPGGNAGPPPPGEVPRTSPGR
jgi:hypothetical protein